MSKKRGQPDEPIQKTEGAFEQKEINPETEHPDDLNPQSQPANNPETIPPETDEVRATSNTDEAQSNLDEASVTVNTVREALSFSDLEAKIVDEQLFAIEHDPQAREHLHISRKFSGIPASLETRERMVLETYSAAPYVTPACFRNPEDLKSFYTFVPIRPGLFPDALFEHLFDIKFKHSRDTTKGALERKEYYPILRRFLSTLRLLSFRPVHQYQKTHSNRIFVITDPELHGLLVSRVPERQKINNYYPDIYSAIRSQKHMLQQYTGAPAIESTNDFMSLGELEMLKKMRYQIQQIIASLQKWKCTSLEERDKIKYLIEDLEDLLSQDINEYKIKAREQFGKAKTLKDEKIDRVNPGSTSARLVSSFNELQKRAAAVFKIMSHVSADLDLLERVRQAIEINFNKTRLYLDVLLDREYFKPFDELNAGSTSVRNNARIINQELLDKKNPGRGVTVLLKALKEDKGTPSPFRQWAIAVLSNLGVVYKLNQNIAEERLSGAAIKSTHNTICEYAIRAQLALKYQQIQQTFVQMLDQLLDHPEQVKAEEIRGKFEKLLNDFNPHAFGKRFQRRDDIKFINSAFAPMTELITQVIALTHEWQKSLYELIGKHYKLRADFKIKSELSDDEANELVALEDQMQTCNQEYRGKIYELFKDCDFTKPVQSLTVSTLPY